MDNCGRTQYRGDTHMSWGHRCVVGTYIHTCHGNNHTLWGHRRVVGNIDTCHGNTHMYCGDTHTLGSGPWVPMAPVVTEARVLG